MVQRKESESTTAVAKSRGGKIKHNEMENVKDVSERRACVVMEGMQTSND